jgi:hypothetical protein
MAFSEIIKMTRHEDTGVKRGSAPPEYVHVFDVSVKYSGYGNFALISLYSLTVFSMIS